MEKTVTFDTALQLAESYGNRPENLELAEKKFRVEIVARDAWMTIKGEENDIELAGKIFRHNARRSANRECESATAIFAICSDRAANGKIEEIIQVFDNPIVMNLKRKSVVPKNINQKKYLKFIGKNDIVFGIGPAGTGKTYLAVAAALKLLQDKTVEKVILTRPAVEAGEALGFLPGDLQEKLLPYLRPLYDAMNDMLGAEETLKLMERQIIEIAPLAYMRGRTAIQRFHNPRRSAKHNHGANDDVPDQTRGKFPHDNHGRHYANRPSAQQKVGSERRNRNSRRNRGHKTFLF